MNTSSSKRPLLSVVVTCYQGAPLLDHTIPTIFDELAQLLPDVDVEMIAVDDGSTDDTFARLVAWREKFSDKMKVIHLARNFGAITALQAGIDHARGDCVTNISQDLQDTPAMLAAMFRSWQAGSKANFIVRTSKRDESFAKKMLANLYHLLFRRYAMPNYPVHGLGVCLMDRQIADELRTHRQRNIDIATYIFSLGYPCSLHPFPRPAPQKRSNWTLAKKAKLAIDNFVNFSYFPIRLMSALGLAVATGGFVFAFYVFLGKLTGWYVISQPPGWATIIILLTVLSGLVMLMLGVIGEYLWRIADAVKNRPLYVVGEIHED